MKRLPRGSQSLLVRTDFTNTKAWDAVVDAVSSLPPEVGGFMGVLAAVNAFRGDASEGEGEGEAAACTIVDDVAYAGADLEQLWKAAAKINAWPVLFVFDSVAAERPDLAVRVVDLRDSPGRSFRTTPDQVYWIESNLSIANMDWDDFEVVLDDDQVFRGFADP